METPRSSCHCTIKALVAIYRPSVFVIKFKEIAGPGTAQRGILGNTITFTQDVSTIASKVETLPHNVHSLCDSLKVVFIGSRRPSRQQLQKVLQVRMSKVHEALKWLKKHHPLYRNIRLNKEDVSDLPEASIPDAVWQTMCHESQEEIKQMPRTSNCKPSIDSILKDDTDNCSKETLDIIMESTGVIDMSFNSMSTDEQTCIAAKNLMENVNDCVPEVNRKSDASENTSVLLVPHSALPVVEFNNPNLWTGGYPWLFPYGLGGGEEKRKTPLSLRRWMNHLLEYHDNRFKEEQPFIFHVYNVLQKRDVCLYSSLAVRYKRFSTTAEKLNNISSKDIEKAISSLANRKLEDANVKALLKQLEIVGSKIPGTGYIRRTYRMEIQGIMIQFGMPMFFITINPADVHSPIVAFFAGHEIDLCEFLTPRERAKLVAQCPVACAKFFDTVINAFIEYLLRYKKDGGGILGDVSAYYGCVEEQSRGSLHLHILVWLQGYKSPSDLKDKMAFDDSFKKDMLKYLEDVIKQQSPLTKRPEESDTTFNKSGKNIDEMKNVTPPTKRAKKQSLSKDAMNKVSENSHLSLSSEEKDRILTKWPEDLNHPSFDMEAHVDKLVRCCQMHKCNHSCHKHGDECNCRYGYPRSVVIESAFSPDEIKVKRWERWVNNYEEACLVSLRCNVDITPICSGKDAKAAAFYMCNYQTKCELSAYHTLPLVAGAIRSMEIGEKNAKFQDIIERSRRMIFKCMNKIASEKEISATHACFHLLGNEDKYCSHRFGVLNILSFLGLLEDEHDEEDTLDEMYRIKKGNSGMILMNDAMDYLHRGSQLDSLTLYDYVANIEKIKCGVEEEMYNNLNPSINKVGRPPNRRMAFDAEHPQCTTHVQRERTKTIVPRLTWFPTDGKRNIEKFSKSMLVLFKPFQKISELKGNFTTWVEAFNNFNFSPVHQQLISNIKEMHEGLSQKAQIDFERRKQEAGEQNSSIERRFLEDTDYYCLSDSDEEDAFLDDNSIEEDEVVSPRRISNLHPKTYEGINIIYDAKQKLYQAVKSTNSSKTVSSVTKKKVQTWKKMLEENQQIAHNAIMNTAQNNEGFSPFASREESSIGEVALVIQHQNTDGIIQSIHQKFNLNSKQQEAFDSIASNVLKRLDGLSVNQQLVYLGGPGGSGKTRVIHALVHLHEMLNIRSSLRLSAFTGTAASEINGSTISSLAHLSRYQERKTNLRKLENTWDGVNTLIIDEVSMLSPEILAKLHRNLVKAKHTSSTIAFGGVDILFVGDFRQFAPVKAISLYHGSDPSTVIKPAYSQLGVDREFGRSLWHQLSKAVILTEQNRIKDKRYEAILKRISVGAGTKADYKVLNSRLMNKIDMSQEKYRNAPFIVPGNEFSREINRIHATWNAQMLGEILHLSTAEDQCAKVMLTNSKLQQLHALSYTQTGNLPKEVELFKGARVMLTKNLAVELGLSNGSMGTVTRIHYDEHTKGRQIPSCVIVNFPSTTCPKLPGLDEREIPIMPTTSSYQFRFPGTLKAATIRRYQLPLVTAYSYTAYKSQGKTLPAVIVDLQPPSKRAVDASFAYVPLSRVQSLQDLVILRPFSISVIQATRPRDLIAQEKRFKEMERNIHDSV